MKAIIPLIAASLLVAAVFTAGLTNVVLAVKPTFQWCFQDASGEDQCFPNKDICQSRADLFDAKCHKDKLESGG